MLIRTTFYIDGFNFYNGLRSARKEKDPSWKSAYWIDFVSFAKQFLDDKHELVAVKYFTAAPLDEGKEIRQSALFRANKYLNGDKFQIIKGKYYRKPIRCQASCREQFEIFEEKRTDVNISVEMMGDCAFNKTDKLILISADRDMVPPLQYILNNFKDKKVKVYFPPCRKSTDLFNLMKRKVVFLDTNQLKFYKARMENLIESGGNSAIIPDKWK